MTAQVNAVTPQLPLVKYYVGSLDPNRLPTQVTADALDPTFGFIYPPIDKTTQYQVLTPSSDPVWAEFSEIQILFGRGGNNTYYGFDHSLSPTQTAVAIDVMLAKSNPTAIEVYGDIFSTLGGNPPIDGLDRFVLGDWNKSYYSNGLNGGWNDFAYIVNFNPATDTIQLHGTASNYQFAAIPFTGMGIFDMSKTTSPFFWDGDLVGIVFANYSLDPTSPQIIYAGDTPPVGPVLAKAQQFGSAGLDIATSVAVDPLGNVYVAGLSNGSLFGQTAGDYDSWVTKFNSRGESLWSKQFGTAQGDQVLQIITDTLGNFYVIGSTKGNLAGSLQSQLQDAYVAKFNSNGDLLWQQQFGSASLTGSSNIALDPQGNLYISGITLTGDKRPITIIDAQDDFWVTKFSPDGQQQWYTQVGTPLDYQAIWDEAYGVTVSKMLDNPANPLSRPIYTTGWTYGGLNGPNHGQGSYDAWITKLNYDGTVAWIRQFGSPNPPKDPLVDGFDLLNFDFSWSVDTDSQGNVYAFGYTQGDLAAPVQGLSDLFLVKYDSLGNQVWKKQFGTSGDDGAFLGSLVIDAQDRLFVAGFTNGVFESDHPNAGSYDAWVISFDANGNQRWVQQLGTPQLDYATKLTTDNLGNLYVTGYTEGSLGHSNAGALDAWLVKLDAGSGMLKDFKSAKTDFNGDGKTDVVIRNKATGENGFVILNDTVVTQFVPWIPEPDTNWTIDGAADFNKDGNTDVVLRNNVTGQNRIALLKGTTFSQNIDLPIPELSDPNWRIGGVGDFNQDGDPDLLYRNKATGANTFALMNGTNLLQVVAAQSVSDLNWEIGGVGDFNKDAKDDVLFRNKATGENAFVLLNGTTVNQIVSTQILPDLNWTVGSVGDYNSDGNTDVLFRNQVTGQNTFALLNGTNVSQIVPTLTVSDTNWVIGA